MPGVEHLPPQNTGDFFVDRYEVTNSEFQRFVDAVVADRARHFLQRRPVLEAQGRGSLAVLKPFNYSAAGQPGDLLFSRWLADFSPRSLA